MNLNRLFALAQARGVSEVEAYLHQSEGFSCSLYEGEIDSYKVSSSITLSLRGVYNGKMGNAVTENVSEKNYEFLVNRLIENANIMGSKLAESIYEGSPKYARIPKLVDDFKDVRIEEKIKTLQRLEKEALNYDPRIVKVDSCSYEEKKSTIQIINSKGLKLKRYYQYGVYDVSVVAKEDDCTKSNFDYVIANNYSKLDLSSLVKRTCDQALKSLHPIKIETKSYPIILTNDIAASILHTFETVFSGDAAIKGMTALKDKLNEKIAASSVTIVDNPLYKGAVMNANFDDEGVACKEKNVIEKGVFKLFLNDRKTAAKMNVEPTGNGFKIGPTASVGVSSYNLYIKNGKVSFDDMVKDMKEGVIITDVQGLHSGVNMVSGDFSVQASGYYVLNGEIAHPVSLLVLSGNFYTMLSEVEQIGNDLKFSHSQVGSPCLKIKSMAISN